MKYYAVIANQYTGIYTDWKSVEKILRIYHGAIFKSFTSQKEANDFLYENNRPKDINSGFKLQIRDKNIIYVAGSYQNNVSGFGLTITSSSKDKITGYGRVPISSGANVGTLYALYVALSLVKGPTIIYTNSHYVLISLSEKLNYWQKNGFDGIENKLLFEGISKLMTGREVDFLESFNKEASTLADKGLFVDSNLIVHKNGIIQPNNHNNPNNPDDTGNV